MQLFLHEVETCSGDGSATTEAWVHQMRDMMLDSEDVFDVFDANQVRACSIEQSRGSDQAHQEAAERHLSPAV
jgi:hypothetical protein